MDPWDRFDEILGRVEQYLLAVLLGVMIRVAFLQIVLRNFLATGISWGDPLVRYLVLWIGFIGASLAVREGKHITIDVFSQWIPGLGNTAIRVVTNLFSAFICGVLTVAAVNFIRNEARFDAATALGISALPIQAIIPVTCGLMTLRFGLQSLRGFSTLFKHGQKGDPQRDR